MQSIQDTPTPTRVSVAAPWGTRELWLGMGLSLLLYVAGSLLGSALAQRLDLAGTPWLGPVVALGQGGMLLPPLLLMRRYGSPARLLGLHHFHGGMLVEVGAMLAVGFCGMLVWGLILLPFGIQAQEPIVPLFGSGGSALASAFLVGALFAPLVEEIVFRGFLFAGLLNVVSPVAAVLGSAALFGALHLQPFAFPVLFLLGVLLATLYYRTGSLWPAILFHFFINASAITLQFLAAQQGLL